MTNRVQIFFDGINAQTVAVKQSTRTAVLTRATVYTDIELYKATITAPSLILSCMAAVMGEAPENGCHAIVPMDQTTPRAADTKYLIEFYGLAGFLILGKPIVRAPSNLAYLISRWAAYIKSDNLTYNQDLVLDDTQARILFEYQDYIRPLESDIRIWIKAALGSTKILPGIKAQLVLTWENQGMRSIICMYQFLQCPTYFILNDILYNQAKEFKKCYDSTKTEWGEHFAYLGVYKSPDLVNLSHRKYPDLYYCAVTQRMKEGGLGGTKGNYVVTQVETIVSQQQLDRLKRPLRAHASAAITEQDLTMRLRELGMQMAAQDIAEIVQGTARRARSRSPP
nr:MAG: nucleocapsid protein [Beetle nyamivirus]